MLRIRPTSIGLSERDVDVHFDQINLYQTLLREGYSKRQIQHFYDTQQVIKRNQENGVGVEDLDSRRTPEVTEAEHGPSTQSPPPRVPHTHAAVRHSSLLRFAQNAESPEDDSTTDIDRSLPPESPKSHVITYRARSQTNPWIESEAEEEIISRSSSYQYLVNELADLAIGWPPNPFISPKSQNSTPLRAEARESESVALTSPIGSTNEIASSQIDYQFETSIIPTLVARGPPTTPPRRSSLANQIILSSGRFNSLMTPGSLPAALSTTPSPVPIRQSTRTEPSTHHGYGSPSRLSIYNDRLPPAVQPQTPADLTRRPILTDRDTAYTAPPGNVGRRRVISNDPSPTTRGRELRSRWRREYQRAEIVEREQLNEQTAGRMLWLEEWAADRVGEENS